MHTRPKRRRARHNAYAYHVTRHGSVLIFRRGIIQTVLRGRTAQKFLREVGTSNYQKAQQLMARNAGVPAAARRRKASQTKPDSDTDAAPTA